MKRYLIFSDLGGIVEFDTVTLCVAEVDGRGFHTPLPSSIEQLRKFRPYLDLVEERDTPLMDEVKE